MAYISILEYTGDGVTTDFLFDIPYLHAADVHGYVDFIEKTGSFADPTTFRFAVAPADGALIQIRRLTNMDTAEHVFGDRAYLKTSHLDNNSTQQLYLQQEATDALDIVVPDASEYVGYAAEWANKAEDSLVSLAAGGDGVDDYSSLHWNAKAAASSAAAALSEANAAASETAAGLSETAAAASETAAAGYAASLSTQLTEVQYLTSADSPKTVLNSGILYICDTSSGSITINAPALALNTPFSIALKKVTDDANTVTFNPNGTDEVGSLGATSYVIDTLDAGVTFYGDEVRTPDTWQPLEWGAGGASVAGAIGEEGAYVINLGRDLSLGTTYLDNFVCSAQTSTPRQVDFNPDGTKMYITSYTTVYQYTLSTPYDASTATYDSISKVVPSLTGIVGMNFKDDGLKVFFADAVAKTLYIYPLTVAWDITTITSTGSTSFPVSAYSGECNGAFINPDGTHAYWCNGLDPDTVEQVVLRVNWSFETHSPKYAGELNVVAVNPSVEGCAFSPDGTKFWVNDDSVGLYQFTCSTPYDITSGTYDSYVFSYAAQDSSGWNCAFSPDGKWMYICGHTSASILQYQLTMEEIPQLPSQTTRGAVAMASSQEVYEGILSYKAVAPTNIKMSWTDFSQLNQNFTTIDLQDTSQFCTIAGVGAMQNLTTGPTSNATVYGYKALEGHISGKAGVTGPVTAIGVEAGSHIKGANNNAMGFRAGSGVNGGWSGTANTIIGDEAMSSVSGSPSFNVAVGNNALKLLHTVGNNNTGVGYDAGRNLQGSCTDNTCVGYQAGSTNTFGSANVYLGHQAGKASGTESNQLYIDVTRRADALIRGDFSARTVTINGTLTATGGFGGGYVDDTTGTALDFTSGQTHAIQPTAASNPTYTFTAPGAGTEVHIIGTNLGAAGTITWPTTVKWEGGTEPTWTASGRDRIDLLWDGTDYIASATLAHA